jgi:hypothetical protein
MFKLKPVMPGCPACPNKNLKLQPTVTFDFKPKMKKDTKVISIYYKKTSNKNALF